jgi:integrase/recombinase XerD
MMDSFTGYLQEDGKSVNTIKGYVQSVGGFLTWFDQSKGTEFKKLHKENIREYISFLKTIKKSKPKTINTKINALVKFNEFLIETKVQADLVITKKDYIKVQQQYASLARVEQKDVEKLRQLILDSGSKRNYAIVTVLAYAGLRISEALNLKMEDLCLDSKGKPIIVVNDGKGGKTREVRRSNDKLVAALDAWKRERKSLGIDNEYLFVSNRNKKLDRTTINKLFKDYSEKLGKEITPHDLRHFFCSHLLSSGAKVHVVANQAGHSNINTTLLYTNPTEDEIDEMMNKL